MMILILDDDDDDDDDADDHDNHDERLVAYRYEDDDVGDVQVPSEGPSDSRQHQRLPLEQKENVVTTSYDSARVREREIERERERET